jgi:hypothetical protein
MQKQSGDITERAREGRTGGERRDERGGREERDRGFHGEASTCYMSTQAHDYTI